MTTIFLALAKLMQLIIYMIVIKCILTWLPGNPVIQKIYNTLEQLTAVFEYPGRYIMSKFRTGMIDFSPLISIIILEVIQQMFVVLAYRGL